MSAGYDSTSPRFFRPADVARLRRNQRRIQVQRLLSIGGRMGLALGVVVGGFLVLQHTRGDHRFAVKSVELTGVVHTPRAELDAITSRYLGENLFKIDIGHLQGDLRRLGWVKRIEAEKKLPDTLRIRIVERTPAALLVNGDRIQYVDDEGLPFAALSPSVGDRDLPVITNASGAGLTRSIALLESLRVRDPQIYSRISEVRPLDPEGFAFFDRELGAVVYANDADLAAKWRDLHALVQAEHFESRDIRYADLRFSDRIVVMPVRARVLQPAPARPVASTSITN